jgi:protein-serine/threonine kinase
LFEKIRLVGKGHIGRVYLVRSTLDDKLYAMKVIKKLDMIKANSIKRAFTEREILISCSNPFIVSLYHCWHEGDSIYFVMEYCSKGDLFSILQKNSRLPEESARFYCAEILLALEYLHSVGYVYRDLKPENVLIHDSGHIKLTDFDLAKISTLPNKSITIKNFLSQSNGMTVSTINPNFTCNSLVGTEQYIAPEMIKNEPYTSCVDWWTFGILMYELLVGRPPFNGKNRQETFANISAHEKIKFPKNVKLSKDAKNIIRNLLNPNPKNRLGSKNGAYDIKDHPFFSGINWSTIKNPKTLQEKNTGIISINYCKEKNNIDLFNSFSSYSSFV